MANGSYTTNFHEVVATLLFQNIPSKVDKIAASVEEAVKGTNVNLKLKDKSAIITGSLAELRVVNTNLASEIQRQAKSDPELTSCNCDELLGVVGTLILDNLPLSRVLMNIERLVEKGLEINCIKTKNTNGDILRVKGNLESVMKVNESLSLMMARQGYENASMATDCTTNYEGMKAGLDKCKVGKFSPSQGGDSVQAVKAGVSEGAESGFLETPARDSVSKLKQSKFESDNVENETPMDHSRFEKENCERKGNDKESGLSANDEKIDEEHDAADGTNGRVCVSSKEITTQLEEGRKVKMRQSMETLNDSQMQIDSQSSPESGSKNDKPFTNTVNKNTTEPNSNNITDSERSGNGQDKLFKGNISDTSDQDNGQPLDLNEGLWEISNQSLEKGNLQHKKKDSNQDNRAKLLTPSSERSISTERATEKTRETKSKSAPVCTSIMANNEVWYYLSNTYGQKLHNIKKENKVSLSVESTDDNVVVLVTPKMGSPTTNVESAYLALKEMVEHLATILVSRIIYLRGRSINSDKCKSVTKIIEKYEREKILFCNKKSAENEKRLHFLGEDVKLLDAAVAEVCEKLGLNPSTVTCDLAAESETIKTKKEINPLCNPGNDKSQQSTVSPDTNSNPFEMKGCIYQATTDVAEESESTSDGMEAPYTGEENEGGVIQKGEIDDAKANPITSLNSQSERPFFSQIQNMLTTEKKVETPDSQKDHAKDRSGEQQISQIDNLTNIVKKQHQRQTQSDNQVGTKRSQNIQKTDNVSSRTQAADCNQGNQRTASIGQDGPESVKKDNISQKDNLAHVTKITDESRSRSILPSQTLGETGDSKSNHQFKDFAQGVKGTYHSLFYIFNTKVYESEIDNIKDNRKVDVIWSPQEERNTVYIKPGQGCLTKSLVKAKEELKALVNVVQRLVNKEVLDFSKVPNIDPEQEKVVFSLLGVYQHKVAWYVVPIRKYMLLYEKTNKPMVDKMIQLMEASLGIEKGKLKSHPTIVQNQPTYGNSKSSGEGSTLSKKATVGKDMTAFILHVCKHKLVDTEKRKGVQFVYDGGDDIIIEPAKSNTTCTIQDLDDVYETFVTLVQDNHTKLTSKDVDLSKQNVLSSDISKAIRDTQSQYGRVLIKETGDKQYRIIGDEYSTKFAMDAFHNFLGLATPQSRHHRRKRHGASGGTQRSNSASDETTVQTSCIVLEVELGHLSKTKVSVRQGDITKENVDIIVNAANESLIHGGDVAGAIVQVGGYGIQQESYEIMKSRHGKPLQLSEVVCTKAGALPCNRILHTVGPVWKTLGKQKVKEALYQCCTNLLSEAGYYGAQSIAIPAIGTGIFGVPKDLCAKVMLNAVLDYLSNHHKNQLKEIRFIDVKSDTVLHFETVFEETLKKNNVPYTKPSISGADQLPVSRESSVDGDHHGQRGTTFGSSKDDTIAITTGHVQGAVARYSPPGKGNGTRGSSFRDSKSNAKGAIPKATATGKSTQLDPLSTDHKAKDDDCSVCLSQMENPKILPCKHAFCKACIDESEKSLGPTCPICKQAFGIITGNMPKGEMKSRMSDYTTIPGYYNCGAIIISYKFPPGIQGPEHPNPGRSYYGDSRTAYLPNNPEGREVLRLLKIAFERRLTFTIGTSVTTGRTDAVVWNDIHHKTIIDGGAQGYGYPDPTYLSRVKEELAAKGVK
ncbi:uncharacterized protein [Ptychodera flava]|uniref:uncharacterized protein n=1 Tax=Ptychodera flava TaxID=63121 RepID=UPI00396A203D